MAYWYCFVFFTWAEVYFQQIFHYFLKMVNLIRASKQLWIIAYTWSAESSVWKERVEKYIYIFFFSSCSIRLTFHGWKPKTKHLILPWRKALNLIRDRNTRMVQNILLGPFWISHSYAHKYGCRRHWFCSQISQKLIDSKATCRRVLRKFTHFAYI